MGKLDLSNGQRIHYEELGPADGPGVLLLHGWCATGRLWSEQTAVLARAGYRTVAIDSAGHGKSSKINNEINMDKFADAVVEIMDGVGFADAPIALMGHSAGGGIAMATYFKYPERFKCLALVQTGYKMCDTWLRKIIWHTAPPFVEMAFSPTAKLLSRPAVNAFAWATAQTYGTDVAQVRRWFHDVQRTRGPIARRELEELTRHDIEKLLPKIALPTLIIGGKYDLLAPARQSVVMGERIPNSELHVLPINHLGKMFRPDLVNPLILDFLARHYPA